MEGPAPSQGHSWSQRPGPGPTHLPLSGSTGLIVSAYSVILQPPDTFLEGVARTGRYTFTAGERALVLLRGPRGSGPWALTQRSPPPRTPTAAIGAIFGLTSCLSAQVREKPDDPLNYFIGGCAGGLTLGARSE